MSSPQLSSSAIHDVLCRVLKASPDPEDADVFHLVGMESDLRSSGSLAKYEGAGSVEVAIAEILSVFSGSGVVDDSSPGDGTSSLGSPGSSVDALFPHHCPSSERGPVQYFCMAYNRGLDELNRWSRTVPELIQPLQETLLYLSRYARIVLLNPDVCDYNGSTQLRRIVSNDFASLLMKEDEHLGIRVQFLVDLTTDVEEPATDFNELLLRVFRDLQRRCRAAKMMQVSAIPYLRALEFLCCTSYVRKLLVFDESWIPPHANGRIMQERSILGPFFCVSPFENLEWIAENIFPSPLTIPQNVLPVRKKTVWRHVQELQSVLVRIVREFLKDIETRPAMLDWVGRVLETNKMRATLQYEFHGDRQGVCSTDGFFVNMWLVLSELVWPILDPTKNKLSTIKPEYTLRDHRYRLLDETRMAWSTEELNQFLQTFSSTEAPNFNSELFFMTAHCMHLGYVRCLDSFNKYRRDVQEAYQKMQQLKTSAGVGSAEYVQAESDFGMLLAGQFVAESTLFEPELIASIMQFFEGSSRYTLGLAFNVPPDTLVQPSQCDVLPEEVPPSYAYLPSYVAENASKTIKVLGSFSPRQVFEPALCNWTLTLLSHMIGSSKFVKNPFIRSGFVEILLGLVRQEDHNRSIASVLESPFMTRVLVPGLLRLYVDFEHTGGHSQFYDKFWPRYHIALIFKTLLLSESHKASILETSKAPIFDQFLNLLINDCVFSLDESLHCLQKIHEHEEFVKTDEYAQLPQDARQERDNDYDTIKKRVSSMCLCGGEGTHMMATLTSLAPEPFLETKMVKRVAEMLNYLLKYLASNNTQIKVENPKQYEFHPRTLLVDVLDCYEHLAFDEGFLMAIVSDLRSYNQQMFYNAVVVLREKALKSEEFIDRFIEFYKKLFEIEVKAGQEAEYFDDVPEELQDALTFDLMDDPVELPGGQVVDRATILRHLQNDTRNPFTNETLSAEMLKPRPDILERIVEFKANAPGSKK